MLFQCCPWSRHGCWRHTCVKEWNPGQMWALLSLAGHFCAGRDPHNQWQQPWWPRGVSQLEVADRYPDRWMKTDQINACLTTSGVKGWPDRFWRDTKPKHMDPDSAARKAPHCSPPAVLDVGRQQSHLHDKWNTEIPCDLAISPPAV